MRCGTSCPLSTYNLQLSINLKPTTNLRQWYKPNTEGTAPTPREQSVATFWAGNMVLFGGYAVSWSYLRGSDAGGE